LVWEEYHPQQDNVIVGNNSRTLGTNYAFCLRAMRVTTRHGWWDIGAHYKARIDAERPEFWTARRDQREDISELERDYSLFINVQPLDDPITHILGDGQPGNLSGLLDALRVGSGLP